MTPDPHEDFTQMLRAGVVGTDELLPVVYDQLRALAGSFFRGQSSDHTLQPTALVHEAYFRLAGDTDATRSWENRRHFVAVAAKAMRQILINHAEARGAQKRGGDWSRVTLSAVGAPDHEADVFALEEALDELERLDERQCRVVELRYLAGLTVEQAADVLGVSPRTVKTDWRMARAWLKDRLG
ncbi:MAG: sigma-70 family RNA polymerase sigma factor [Planctomycetota bacterium]|jgi:RNA polymerase sigma factor (TIGR02999 family)